MSQVCRIPGGVRLLIRLMGVPAVRHMRSGYGGMSLRGIPDEVMDDWLAPAARSRDIRRDLAKFATGAPDRRTLLAWSEGLRAFDRPVLVVWAKEDRLMPREHGPRLAALYPRGRLVEIADSSTLVPEDQPERLAEVLTDFLVETGAEPARRTP
jgi:pimeloyl-ACP methyl ester carboxylesterase